MSDTQNIYFILQKINRDIESLDAKWESQLKAAGVTAEKIRILDQDIQGLKKIVHIGNGQPSILVQLNKLANKLDNLYDSSSHQHSYMKSELDEVCNDLDLIKAQVGVRTPKEVKLEQWKTWGKVAGVIGLCLPGIIALLENIIS